MENEEDEFLLNLKYLNSLKIDESSDSKPIIQRWCPICQSFWWFKVSDHSLIKTPTSMYPALVEMCKTCQEHYFGKEATTDEQS